MIYKKKKSAFTHTSLSSLLDFFEPSSLSVELALRLCARFVELLFLFFLEGTDLCSSSSDELSEEVEEVESEEELDDDDEDATAAAVAAGGSG